MARIAVTREHGEDSDLAITKRMKLICQTFRPESNRSFVTGNPMANEGAAMAIQNQGFFVTIAVCTGPRTEANPVGGGETAFLDRCIRRRACPPCSYPAPRMGFT